MSYNPHQEPVLTLTLYEKDELFAGPRQIGYCLDRDGVLKSEKGLTSFARGELGTRPVVEAFAFGKDSYFRIANENLRTLESFDRNL